MSPALNRESSLRVFMTADAVGGVWQYALDLAEGLRPHGVETVLAVLGPDPSADQQHRAQEAGVRLIPSGLPLDWTASRRSEVEEAGRAVARMAEEARPDVVHLNSPALAAGPSFPAPVVAVCHSCVATWWQAVRGGPLPEEFLWRADLVRQGYLAADMLLAPTAAFARATARFYGLPRDPVVVPNGRRVPPAGEQAGSDLFAFTAGRLWDDGKNVAAVDRAAARLALPVVAAGPREGPHGARVELRHVRALGILSDAEVARHLRARPIFVSAARYEPFGLAVLEAAQAGCPLVLSDIPTFRELWDGVASFVPCDDDGAIARAVESLARDDGMRSRFGAAARERAGRYGLDAMAAGVLAAYRAVLAPEGDRSSVEEAAA